MTTYAVIWQESGEESRSGRVELDAAALVFTGGANGVAVERSVPYTAIASVGVARFGANRLGERPTLVLERRGGTTLRIASVVHSWIVAELAERLTQLRLGAAS